MSAPQNPRVTQGEAFWAKVDIRGEGECWPWIGSKTSRGYGLLSTRRATHIALELVGRHKPEGARLVRHHCDNPECVNPAHLAWGNDAENVADMVTRRRHHANRRTHCIHGHPFSGYNLMIRPNGQRECRTCRNEINRRCKQRARAALTKEPDA